MTRWASDYIGIPYESRGRTRAGIDCWGLALLVWREQFGVELPDFEYHGDSAKALADYSLDVQAEEVSELIPGDLALIRQRGRVRHVGVFAGDGRMLHVMDAGASVLEPINSPRMRSAIESWRRPIR